MSSDVSRGFSDLVGVEFTDIDPGYSRCVVDVTDDLMNPYGVVHGSVFHVMADTGMGAAIYPELAEDEQCATIEIKTSYLDAVRSGTLTCETDLVRRGRSVAHLESDVSGEGGLVAKATGSYSIFAVD
jgi:acyl-CoA thioesterase